MPVDASPVKMCHAQECIGVEPLSPIQENDPESPACSVADDCDWGKYKRQEGPGWSVSLRQSRKGFKCQASIDALLSVGPDVAFDILTDPEVKQWRQVKECTYRKVWEDDGNVQRVEVEQSATAFFKTIYTRMHVVQDRAAGTMQFSLAKPGMLKHFEGQWTVTAVEGDSQAARVHLEQTMQPGFAPPPPLQRFFRKAMLGKAAQMLVQLQEEAERIAQPAEVPASKPAQLAQQPSFDITAHAGAAPAAPVLMALPTHEPAQERSQPVPATPEANAGPRPPTDDLFASWTRIVSPQKPRAAPRGLVSHPICCVSDSELD